MLSPQEFRTRSFHGYPQQVASMTPRETILDPAIAPAKPGISRPPVDDGFELALKAWARFRFVRAGWFTAKEGLDYIDYYYRYLAPLTPITIPYYHHPSSHETLLTQEPMLAVTLLMISSRHMRLSGYGAATRPYLIHEKLWAYTQKMIDRVLYGQEQFGGGFCGAGSKAGNDVDPLSRKGLRTLGTIESFLLLTEWHPRALHFPPEDDNDELMITGEDNLPPTNPTLQTGAHREGQVRGPVSRRIESWLEPCWRSDRMCWMLLGNAMTLAYEIGVFDENAEEDLPQDDPAASKALLSEYLRRKNKVKDLLLIYVSQTSGRLGVTSMLPKHFNEPTIGRTPSQLFAQSMEQGLVPRVFSENRVFSEDRSTLSTIQGTTHLEEVHETVLYFWMEIASVMKSGNQQLFRGRIHTLDIIKSGRYVSMLLHFQPVLARWKRDFDSCRISKWQTFQEQELAAEPVQFRSTCAIF